MVSVNYQRPVLWGEFSTGRLAVVKVLVTDLPQTHRHSTSLKPISPQALSLVHCYSRNLERFCHVNASTFINERRQQCFHGSEILEMNIFRENLVNDWWCWHQSGKAQRTHYWSYISDNGLMLLSHQMLLQPNKTILPACCTPQQYSSINHSWLWSLRSPCLPRILSLLSSTSLLLHLLTCPKLAFNLVPDLN